MVADLTNAYATVEELRDLLRDAMTSHDSEYERCLLAASRAIDAECGRQFWQSPTAVARLFRPDQCDLLWTGDISTTTGLVLTVDQTGDGAFEETWTLGTDFVVEPFERLNDSPVERLAAVGSKYFPIGYTRRPTVSVVAKWGWSSVPSVVTQATLLVAAELFRSKDIGSTARTMGPTGAGGFPDTPRPVIQVGGTAAALVAPLRTVVVA